MNDYDYVFIKLKYGIANIDFDNIDFLIEDEKLLCVMCEWMHWMARQTETLCKYNLSKKLNDSVRSYLDNKIDDIELNRIRDETNHHGNAAYEIAWFSSYTQHSTISDTVHSCIKYVTKIEYPSQDAIKKKLIELLIEHELK